MDIAIVIEGCPDTTSVALLEDQFQMYPEVLTDSFSAIGGIDDLYLVAGPARSVEDPAAVLQSLSASDLVRNKIVINSAFSHGVRQKSWLPLRDNPTLAAHPVSQLLFAFSYHGQESGRNCNSFYMGDAFMTPHKVVTALFRLLAIRTNNPTTSAENIDSGAGVDVSYCVASASDFVHGMHEIEIGPLPAETYAVGKARYHFTAYQNCSCKLRDLARGQWTVLVRQSTCKFRDSCFSYALVRARRDIKAAPQSFSSIAADDFDIASLDEFLVLTAESGATRGYSHTSEDIATALEAQVKALERARDAYWTERGSRRSDRSETLPEHRRRPTLSLLEPDDVVMNLREHLNRIPENDAAWKRAEIWFKAHDSAPIYPSDRLADIAETAAGLTRDDFGGVD